MTHLANKNPFKNKGLGFFGKFWQVLARLMTKKNRLKTMTCHKWHRWQGKNGMTGIFGKRAGKKQGEKVCN